MSVLFFFQQFCQTLRLHNMYMSSLKINETNTHSAISVKILFCMSIRLLFSSNAKRMSQSNEQFFFADLLHDISLKRTIENDRFERRRRFLFIMFVRLMIIIYIDVHVLHNQRLNMIKFRMKRSICFPVDRLSAKISSTKIDVD